MLTRPLAAMIATTVAISIAGCSSDPAVPTETPMGSFSELELATPTPSSAATTPSAPRISETGEISGTDPAGYTATINYSLLVSGFTSSVTEDPPGFASIIYSAKETASVTNTTPSRNNPGSFYWGPILLYPVESDVCSLTKDLRQKSTSASLGLAALPLIKIGASAAFCGLPLTELIKDGPQRNNGTLLGVGQTAPLTPAAGKPSGGTGVLSNIPESVVPALLNGLTVPTKIVYLTSPIGHTKGEGSFTPVGEHCEAQFMYEPGKQTATNPFRIFVPPNHSGICPV